MATIFAPVSSIRIVRGTRWEDNLQLVDEASQAPVTLTGITGILMRVRKTISSSILLSSRKRHHVV